MGGFVLLTAKIEKGADDQLKRTSQKMPFAYRHSSVDMTNMQLELAHYGDSLFTNSCVG